MKAVIEGQVIGQRNKDGQNVGSLCVESKIIPAQYVCGFSFLCRTKKTN